MEYVFSGYLCIKSNEFHVSSCDTTPDLMMKCLQVGKGQETDGEWIRRRDALMRLYAYKRKLQKEGANISGNIFSKAIA